MGAVNFVTTIIRMRAPGMGYFRMPVFIWTAWAAQTLQLIGLPALTGGAIMLLFDLSFGTSFFRPEGGGDPVLYQHFFWFYSHPAVYVMVLPVFGIFSEADYGLFAQTPLRLQVCCPCFIYHHFLGAHCLGSPYVLFRDTTVDAKPFHGDHHVDCCSHWGESLRLVGNSMGRKNTAKYTHAIRTWWTYKFHLWRNYWGHAWHSTH